MSIVLRFAASLALAACAWNAAAQTFEVPRELWDRPRTGSAILSEPRLKEAVSTAIARPEAQILIHHSPGQESLMQAEELRSWLGALAIDTRRMALRGYRTAGATLALEIVP